MFQKDAAVWHAATNFLNLAEVECLEAKLALRELVIDEIVNELEWSHAREAALLTEQETLLAKHKALASEMKSTLELISQGDLCPISSS